ncbi:hypothetical protein CRE_31238 [Caenorhabditis remanei]|uniref:Uncharacterized protein n=1 Tax=Caenorhabditis remanei TaxID=31234 RepID=E3MLR6_CAERE|nr:hypothetical protein CRE_31238 [Caenorhabditis remanei]
MMTAASSTNESSSSTSFVQHFYSKEVSNKGRLLCLFQRLRNVLIIVLTPIICGLMLNWEGPEWKCAFCVCIFSIYWMSEVMPLAITAMLPVVLYPLVGVIDANTTAKKYMNDTNFLFIGGLIMAAAVEKCDLHERVALSVLRCVGSEPKWIMLGFMTVTALLSSFISNTATTAMMVPIVQSVVQQLISSLEHNPTNGERGRPGCKKMATGLVLSISFAANIGGTGTATRTPSNLVMLGQLNAFFPKVDGSLNYVTWILFAFPLMLLCLGVAWATLVWFFLRDASKEDEAVTEMLKTRYDELPRMTYAEKSVSVCFCLLLSLWIFRDPGIIPGFGVYFNKGAYTDATSAMIVAFLLFILPSEKPDLATYYRKEDLDEKGCLMDWKTMQAIFPWSVVLLLGGGFALLDLSSIGHLPLWILQLLTMSIAMIITNICSNTVTASIFVPIVATLAQKAGHHPFTLMLPTTLACSFAFIFPVVTPPNAIVFGSGMVKVSDMAFVGGLISMELLVLTIVYMNSIAYVVLPLLKFPSWAVIANSTMQT